MRVNECASCKAFPCTDVQHARRELVSDQSSSVSKAFQFFMADAPGHAQAWGGMVQGLASASTLDGKTAALAYLAVLAALRLESGVPFHVQQAKQRGASRDEVISAVLVGLPAAGHGVTQVLPAVDRRLRCVIRC